MIALLIVAGLVTLAFPRSRGQAWQPFAAAGGLYLVFSNGLVAALLMGPLEYAHPRLSDPADHPEVRAIVVLTGYAAEDGYLPFSSLLNSTSVFRVVESVFIFGRRPDCEVIVSGTSVAAEVMAGHLRRLGVPDVQLVVDGASRGTADSARRLKPRLKDTPVFLVTSAGHMPRAIASFRKQGVPAIPAPTDYQLPREARRASWRPSPTHLKISDLAAHEYIGIAWYRLTGRI